MLFSINSGLLEACVLAILKTEDSYGYKLTQDVKALIPISESTLYPVLRRLQAEGFLQTYDRAIDGRMRKYYAVTNAGKIRCHEHVTEWAAFKKIIDGIFIGDTEL